MPMFKKSGGKIFAVQFNKAEERALDQEIKKQIVENDRAFDMDKESSILWMLHTQFGFGPKRLKLAWKLFYAETLKLREYYLMDQEIKKQIVENDRAFDMDKESSILWMLHTQFGFGPKRLKLAWKLFYAETRKLREHYLMEQADDGWLARKKLKDIGCDIEEWYREEGGKTDA